MDDLIQEMLEPDRPAPGAVARRRRFVATSTIIGLAAIGITSLTTNALFTSEDDSSRSGFLSGTIQIEAGTTAWTTSPGNAAPGDTYFVTIPVENSGTLQLRYAVELSASAQSASSGPSDLLDYLTYSIFAGLTEAQCSTAGVSAATAASSAVLSSAPIHFAIGSQAVGHQSVNGGDRVLPVGGSEVLCLRVAYSIDADNSVQGASADLAFNFYAEQTANN